MPHAAEEAVAHALGAVRSAVGLRQRPQRGLAVARQHAVHLPLLEQLGGVRVRVVALGKVDLDDVVRAARRQVAAQVRVDHVVRRGGEAIERAGGGEVVVDRAQRLDVGHRAAQVTGWPRQSPGTSSTTLPVARRSSITRIASAPLGEREALPDDRAHGARLDHAVERRADLAVEVRLGHHVAAPARADDLGVAQQQAVDLHLGDRAAGEADHHDAPVLAQRAQAVGEAVAADRVEHDVDAAAVSSTTCSRHGPSERTTSSAPASRATCSFSSLETTATVVGAEALRDLERGGADAAGGAVDEHALALRQAAAQLQREVGGVVVEDQRRALREVERLGQREGHERGRDGDLGHAAERRERGDAVAGREAGAVGGGAHGARHLGAGHERQVAACTGRGRGSGARPGTTPPRPSRRRPRPRPGVSMW